MTIRENFLNDLLTFLGNALCLKKFFSLIFVVNYNVGLGCEHIFSNGSDVYFIFSSSRVSFDDANRMCKSGGGKIAQIFNQEREKFLDVLKNAYLNSKMLLNMS